MVELFVLSIETAAKEYKLAQSHLSTAIISKG